jgi:hypothetical protein
MVPPSSVESLLWLAVLALPVACVAWTVTHEELFREFQEMCKRRNRKSRTLVARKFFYAFTCEYCFSHYVAAAAVVGTGFRLLFTDWRGAVIGWFSLVAIANVYMSLFARLRVDIKSERLDIAIKEQETAEPVASLSAGPGASSRR